MKIFVDSTDKELLRLYETARDKHNAVFWDQSVKECDKYYDAGFDLFCPTDGLLINKNARGVKVDHAVKCAMKMFTTNNNNNDNNNNGEYNVGYYLYPRSSTGMKTPLRLSNSVGIIDAGYRGNITGLFDHIGEEEDFVVEKYQRLLQLCPPDLSYPFVVTLVSSLEELGVTSRGSGGLGSTGK